MIAVIADDFTGAAEIGGIGIRHGFEVTILNGTVEKVDSDILIIATDTRSQDPPEAGRIISKITEALLAFQPEFIFKKIDSLFRGNVGEELIAQLDTSKKSRALIIPANPALNRTIEDGVYYANGIPLNEFFAGSPEGKRGSSKVKELIGEEARSITTVISNGDPLPAEGLIIGNTSTVEDLPTWVQKIDNKTIPAGGSGFFDALLNSMSEFKGWKQPPISFGEKVIFICGSAFLLSRQVVQKAKESGQCVMYIPRNLLCTAEKDLTGLTRWADEIIWELKNNDKVILAVDEIDSDNDNLALKIQEVFAGVLHKAMEEIKIDELIIEGGATAYSIIEKQGYKKFYPVQELAPGVIRMKVEENPDIFLTLKPGSYEWPNAIWQY